MRPRWSGLLTLVLCGCALGSHSGGFDGTAGPDAGSLDAAVGTDTGGIPVPGPEGGDGTDDGSAAVPDTGSGNDTGLQDTGAMDTGAVDTGLDTGVDTGAVDAGLDATGMDPLLSLPDPAGQICNPPGSMGACPMIEVCRIATPSSGRCEGCTSCNNLGAACSQSSDCDILFQCYAGKCTNICPLGTSYCGAVSDCLDVGNATYGVCRPM